MTLRRRLCGAVPAPVLVGALSPLVTQDASTGPMLLPMAQLLPPILLGLTLAMVLTSFALDILILERGGSAAESGDADAVLR